MANPVAAPILTTQPLIKFRFNHIRNCWEMRGFLHGDASKTWRWIAVETDYIRRCLDAKRGEICVEETVSKETTVVKNH